MPRLYGDRWRRVTGRGDVVLVASAREIAVTNQRLARRCPLKCVAASRSARYTERCWPPVQPTATVR